MKPIAYINVEKRTLEFATPMAWHTPTVANLDRIPLFTKEALALQALHDENERLGLYKDAYTQTEKEPVAWRELCRRLYVELFHCDQQMMAALDEEGYPMWQQGATVRDVLADAKTALETSPPQQEQDPVAWRTFDGEGGYDYRSYEDNDSYADDWDKRNPNHKGWVDKLYTHAQPEQEPVAWGVDWGRAGDIPCVSIIKRLPNGGIEVVAVEYAPYTFKEKNT